MDWTRDPLGHPTFVDLTDRWKGDPLTRLPNRAQFEELVDLAIEHHRRDRSFSAIVFVDLVDLDDITRRHGRLAGDQLLLVVASRIIGAVAATDVACRFGRAEFTVLRRDLDDPDEAFALAQRVRAAVLQPYAGPSGWRATFGVAVADGRLPTGEVLRRTDGADLPGSSLGSHGLHAGPVRT